jgi:hypothetical protein
MSSRSYLQPWSITIPISKFILIILFIILHRKCSKQAQPDARLSVFLLLRTLQMTVQRRKLRALVGHMILVIIKI